MRNPSSSPSWIRAAALLAVAVGAVLSLRSPALTAEQREERMIGPGVRWQRWIRPEGPWAIQIVEADLSQSYIHASPLHAGEDVAAAVPISQQAARATREDRYPIAAVNGDYYCAVGDLRGLPIGAVVRAGEVYHNPFPRSALIFGPNRSPRIAILRMNAWVEGPEKRRRAIDRINNPRGDDHLVLYTPRYGPSTRANAAGVEAYLAPESFTLTSGVTHKATVRAVSRMTGDAWIAPDRWILSGVGKAAGFLRRLRPGDEVAIRVDLEPEVGPEDEVIGGGPQLVRNGQPSLADESGILESALAASRQPRTAVGYRDNTLFLVTVDGRQSGHSAGMTLAELARLMVELGCQEALNLDGGGSTTMWVRGELANRPSDGRERSVANGLAIFSTAPKGPPVRLTVRPAAISGLAGVSVPVRVQGEDQYYNPVALGTGAVRWQLAPELGRMNGRGQLQLAADVRPAEGRHYLEGELRAEAGDARAGIPVRVYAEPPRLEVVPVLARLLPGQACTLGCRAFDEAGRPLAVPSGLVRWSCDAALGRVDERGCLQAGRELAAGHVMAAIGSVQARARVTVGSVTRLVDDFEHGMPCKVAVHPREVEAAAAIVEGQARGGMRCLCLRYDFTVARGTRAAYAQVGRPLGAPLALRLAVFGDGTRVWLRARLRDAARKTHLIDFTRNLNWVDEWRDLVALVPPEAQPPIVLESIYVVEPRAENRVRGRIMLDDLRADYPPDLPAPGGQVPGGDIAAGSSVSGR